MVIRIILSIFRSFNLNFVHEMMLVIAASALVRGKSPKITSFKICRRVQNDNAADQSGRYNHHIIPTPYLLTLITH